MFFRFVQETSMSDPTGPHPTGNISWGAVQQSWPVPVQIAKLPSQPPSSTKYGQSGCWTYEGGQSHLQTELGCSVKEVSSSLCEWAVSQSGRMGLSHPSPPPITTHRAGVLGGPKRGANTPPSLSFSCTRTCTSFLWLPQQITTNEWL